MMRMHRHRRRKKRRRRKKHTRKHKKSVGNRRPTVLMKKYADG